MSSSHLKSSLQGCARGIGIEVGTGTLRCLSVERKGGFLQINSLSECPVLADDEENQETAVVQDRNQNAFHTGVRFFPESQYRYSFLNRIACQA